jgi:S-adenosylmethionine-diacylglycerol 3-amino-3-carboxypropyl transferase
MKKSELMQKILQFEFENRIFFSLGIVLTIFLVSYLGFPETPSNMIMVGNIFGISETLSVPIGFSLVAFLVTLATLLRMWAGTILSSPQVMAFKLQKEVLKIEGPYLLTRNPIYLADLIAFCSFALCFTPVGVFLPVLLFLHYTQLIRYEERGLNQRFGNSYEEYKKNTPRFFPNINSFKRLMDAFSNFHINKDGIRHNAQYVLLIPGFIVSAFTGNLLHAIFIGLFTILDWAIVHTRIGLNPDKARRQNQKKFSTTHELKKSKVFDDIIYAQCWEDPLIDIKAFQNAPDGNIFSITSGGCNLLAFLTLDPPKLFALDLSPYQNYLLELKIAAFREFEYEELIEFLGVKPSDKRLEMYLRLKSHLKHGSIAYWDNNTDKIKIGVINSGRYENYMRFLAKWLKRLVGQNIPDKLFSCNTKEERLILYNKKWNNFRWRILTKIFLSRKIMTTLFTGRFFDQLEESFSFGDHFRTKIKRALIDLPLRENHFLAFILLGRFYDLNHLPLYLRKENFDVIKTRLDRIEIITGDCLEYFRSLPSDVISRFNFSNIFEWITPEAYRELLLETIRVAKKEAILTYRNLLVPRSRPEELASFMEPQIDLSNQLLSEELSFIYRAFIVEKIIK